MAKSLKALAHGYVLFRCDGKHFLTYAQAKAALRSDGPTSFDGLHVWKGWQCFYQVLECPVGVQPTVVVDKGWLASADQ